LAESNPKQTADRISFLSPGVSIAESADPNRPRQVMGLRDLVLFYVITGISLRWIATAAAAGPSSIVIWVGAWLCFYTPLALSVLELSSRYPNEGGLYVWSKRAFGDFSGFMAAWTYWTSNLPYFPAVLYFAASNVLFMRQANWEHLSSNATFYIVFFLLTLSAATLLNIVGLDVGKWLHNIGAIAMWIPVSIVIVMGFVAWHRYGSATSFTLHSMIPSTHINDLIFWSVLTFAFGGCETALFMGEEIKNARRTIPLALLSGGVTVTICYILGTVCVLLALPSSEVNSLQGLVQAVSKTASRVGYPGILPLVAFLIALSNIGAAGAYLAAVAPASFRRRARSLSAGGVRGTASTMENSVGGFADTVYPRCRVYFSRPGGHEGERRLRCSGQHGRDYVFHSVFVSVRRDDQAAARTRGAGCDSSAGGNDRGETGRDRGISDYRADHCAVADSAAGRTEQAAGAVQSDRGMRSAGGDWGLDLFRWQAASGDELARCGLPGKGWGQPPSAVQRAKLAFPWNQFSGKVSKTQPGFARRTAEGGCPHVNQTTQASLSSAED
jgi:Amino acid permease